MEQTFKQYKVRGLDCAQCAGEIETALRRLDGFNDASVNFATATITLPSDRLEVAQQTISRIEPDARLVTGESPAGSQESRDSRDETRAHLVRAAVALLLAAAGVAFSEELRGALWGTGEYLVFGAAYLVVGWRVLWSAARNLVRGRVFDEMFLMSIATLGAIAINEMAEAVAVMLFYTLGEYIQGRAVGRSRRSIEALLELRPDTARVVEGDSRRETDPNEVAVGSVIEVWPGERVPLDGTVATGESTVDTSALTGESMPREVAPGQEVLAGFVNESGVLQVEVTRPFGQSSVARILELVEDASARKAPTERFISKFASVYTPIVVAIAAAVAFVPPLIIPGASLEVWVYRALVALVISCPCALVISVPLGYLGGIGGAARSGVLVKGASYLDRLNALHTVVFDKTGTITRGEFTVTGISPAPHFDERELLELAAAAEGQSSHPIARSIVAAARARGIGGADAQAEEVTEERGRGIRAVVAGRVVLAGNAAWLADNGVTVEDPRAQGTVTSVAVDGAFVGTIEVSDEIKPGAAEAVARLGGMGVERTAMLTGDTRAVARAIADQVAIDDVHAELLPEQKVERLEEIAAGVPRGRHFAFVGDGINDAPVLMRSDVGIAMGALGSDAAIEAADVVLMDDRVEGVANAIAIARHTRRVVLQNIVFALGVKLVFLAFGAFGMATMWEAVIADMGVSIAAVLNATRTLRYARGLTRGVHTT